MNSQLRKALENQLQEQNNVKQGVRIAQVKRKRFEDDPTIIDVQRIAHRSTLFDKRYVEQIKELTKENRRMADVIKQMTKERTANRELIVKFKTMNCVDCKTKQELAVKRKQYCRDKCTVGVCKQVLLCQRMRDIQRQTFSK